uniref:Protein popC n=2 Tax=Triticinae TaxID=1648030 RepID=M8C8G5_AEGTA
METSFQQELCSNKDCRYVLLTDLKLSNKLSARTRALRCVGSGKMELSDDSFSYSRCLRVLELNDSLMLNLPNYICQLRHLGYLNLSGCSGLVIIPKSLGDLLNLLYINLSGCSGLIHLPESFGKLINLAHIDLSGCSGLVNISESFGKLKKLLHIDLTRCSGLVNLPDSFGKLTSLKHIDLSDCSGLEKLPQSFGKLTNLMHINLSRCSGIVTLPPLLGKLIYLLHINLSGCSGLVNLPESFGNLINLVHINLSGCCGLLNLPESFGNLVNLLHIDLSCCHGLDKLPESFRKLKFLVHLDLSFWSCFEGVQKALAGLTNLQHLNLSHPCCYLAQQQSCLEGLKDVLGQLTKIEYLNLSMFLNPIFYSESVERTHGIIERISGFSSLEHLDLSHNRFLHDLPESLGELNNLQTLDLSGCIRLKSIAKRIGEIRSLQSINVRNCRSLKSCELVVKPDNGEAYRNTSIVELENANLEELEISCLENVKSAEQAEQIRMALEGKIEKLKLCWTVGSQVSMEGNTLLGELLPSYLQCLELHGYSGETRLSAWWTSTSYWWTSTASSCVSTLVEVTVEGFLRCSRPPPLCLLLNLRRAVFRRMASITRFDVNDLTDGNRAAIHRLPKFTLELDDMESLEEFKTTYDRRGKECVLPAIGELVITGCPKLCFGPFTPRARRLVISDCSKLMVYSWWNRGGQSVETPITSVLVNELVVKNCNLALYNWTLLHSLPGLYSLTVKDCRDLKTLPRTLPHTIEALSSLQSLCLSNCWIEPLEQHLGDLTSLRELKIASCNMFKGFTRSLQRLTSLGSMHLIDCNSITSLPDWLGDLTNLEKLAIHRCPAIESLPGSINKLTNLKDLHILDCPKLKGWCEREENKKIMAHIQPNYDEEHGTSSSRPGNMDEGYEEGELEDWLDGVEEEEPEAEAVSTDAVENPVATGNTDVVVEEEKSEAALTDASKNSVVTDKADVVAEEEAEAVLPDAVDNSVVTGNRDAVEEEATRDVDAAAAADQVMVWVTMTPVFREASIAISELKLEFLKRMPWMAGGERPRADENNGMGIN